MSPGPCEGEQSDQLGAKLLFVLLFVFNPTADKSSLSKATLAFSNPGLLLGEFGMILQLYSQMAFLYLFPSYSTTITLISLEITHDLANCKYIGG